MFKVAPQRGNQTVHEIQGMPGNLSVLAGRGVYNRSFPSRAVAQRNSSDFMTEAREFQRQLAEPAEAVVEQILAHVLAFAEN